MAVESSPVARQFTANELPEMPLPRAALMCSPEWFDVVDVKNPFMEGQQGCVDRRLAKQQWAAVRQAFESIGVEVRTDAPLPGCEDMVFCANPVFTGLDSGGRRICILSHMRYPSRHREVFAHARWFRENGYRVLTVEDSGFFEGGGDALWHPGRRLIWGGYGFRTNRGVYDRISEILDAPVLVLELKMDRFYHLDTCFCPLDEQTALVYPPALSGEAVELLEQMFPRVIEVDPEEAASMACNAAPFFGKYVVIQQGLEKVNHQLREMGFQILEVDTSEFMKSGGSVFCMKMHLF